MLEDYKKHCEEREEMGIPPLPLDAEQTAEVVNLLKKENDENPKQEDKLEPLIEEVSSAEKDIPVQVKEDIKETSIASSPNSVERVGNDNQDSKEDKVKSPVDQKVKNKKNNQEKEKPEKHNKEEKKEKKSSAEKDGSKGKRKKIEETTK